MTATRRTRSELPARASLLLYLRSCEITNAQMLESERLLLRQWRDSDKESFAAINSDAEVMEFFPATLSRSESDDLLYRFRSQIDQDGFGIWALERSIDETLIGFLGLHKTLFEAHFTPCVEIGWRLARDAWGFGYATEAAREVLSFGFNTLDLSEIVSMTTPANQRSRAVMQRLGMNHDPADDFDHPKIDEDSKLRQHVLYRLTRDQFVMSR